MLCLQRGNGTGGRSIYGRKFEDENFSIAHFPGMALILSSSSLQTSSDCFAWHEREEELTGNHGLLSFQEL